MEGMRASKEILYLRWAKSVGLVPSYHIAKIYAYFGIALRANLVSHFGISTRVAGVKHVRKVYM